MGYLLPWGQMSYWGAQVIVNLFAAIPFVGPDLALLIRGDFVVGDATLNRFFSFHVIAVPLVLLGLVVAHIIALHEVGSNNPDGVEIKAQKDADGKPLDGIPFHPYYTVHDVLGISVFLMAFSAIVFFAPEFGGYFLEYNNFIPADPLKTPAHIAPVWYFTPFYSMLRAITGEMMTILMLTHRASCCPECNQDKNVGYGQGRYFGRGGGLYCRNVDHRCQILGRGGYGRGGRDSVLLAVVRPQPCEVHALPPQCAQSGLWHLCYQFLHPRVLGYSGTISCV